MRSAVDLSGPASVQPSVGPSCGSVLKLNCLPPCSSRLGPLDGFGEGPASPMLGPTALAMEAWRDPVVLWDPERSILVAATPGSGAKGCWWVGGRWKPPISADACRCAGVEGVTRCGKLMQSCCPSHCCSILSEPRSGGRGSMCRRPKAWKRPGTCFGRLRTQQNLGSMTGWQAASPLSGQPCSLCIPGQAGAADLQIVAPAVLSCRQHCRCLQQSQQQHDRGACTRAGAKVPQGLACMCSPSCAAQAAPSDTGGSCAPWARLLAALG